jgi:predicted 3-demethylubiquinone-9 3-methyltransferase (glyoxalase superfamily)
MSPIVPCLWFDAQAEDAARFYASLFPGGRVTATTHYPEGTRNPARRPPGSVITAEFEVAGQRFTALNGGPMFTINPSISFFVLVDAAAEVDRYFAAFAEGGKVMMPLDAYPWSPRYAWVQDRFGVSWQLMLEPDAGPARVAPCLMFSDDQHGRAADAMAFYAGVFSQSRITTLERYDPSEAAAPLVKHARFTLDGQPMVAMDTHVRHGFTFDEGLSLQVMCRDQAEVDRYWAALTEGGSEGPCGWLKDRFGLSWQVVPDALGAWLRHPDAAARERAFAAMMDMSKPDVAALEAALAGPG